MEVLSIILLIILIGVIALFVGLICTGDLSVGMFGNSITRKVETRQRLLGEVEVLKKEQTVKVEETVKVFEVKKAQELDGISAQINACKAQIKNLEKAKQDKDEMLDKELKVEIDKVINKYNREIVSKQNKAKKLNYFVDAEKKNMEDVINPTQPNAPEESNKTRKILLETAKDKKVSKKETK